MLPICERWSRSRGWASRVPLQHGLDFLHPHSGDQKAANYPVIATPSPRTHIHIAGLKSRKILFSCGGSEGQHKHLAATSTSYTLDMQDLLYYALPLWYTFMLFAHRCHSGFLFGLFVFFMGCLRYNVRKIATSGWRGEFCQTVINFLSLHYSKRNPPFRILKWCLFYQFCFRFHFVWIGPIVLFLQCYCRLPTALTQWMGNSLKKKSNE